MSSEESWQGWSDLELSGISFPQVLTEGALEQLVPLEASTAILSCENC
jgi:hypothetical protein